MKLGAILILMFAATGLAAAQQPSAQQRPAPQPVEQNDAPADREQLERVVDAYRRILLDWGGLTQYGSENTELKSPAGEDRVVFLGDEITENWGTGKTKFFPGRPYLNRGITRQTVAQMLVRFRQDVIDLKPKVVVIQAGSNDIASVMGPSPEATMAEHFMSMVELAKLHHIRVVLASVTPVCDCFKKISTRRPAGKIISLNNWLKAYAKESGSVYLDYYSALAEGRAMKQALTSDGLVPNDAGYDLMAPLAEKAIAAALAKN
jgi:acyl-CoA thioesterase-1